MAEDISQNLAPLKPKARFSLPIANVAMPVLSIVVAALAGAVIILLMGYDPLKAYAALAQGRTAVPAASEKVLPTLRRRSTDAA